MYRDDREALLCHAAHLERELARVRGRADSVESDRQRLLHELSLLRSTFGRSAFGPARPRLSGPAYFVSVLTVILVGALWGTLAMRGPTIDTTRVDPSIGKHDPPQGGAELTVLVPMAGPVWVGGRLASSDEAVEHLVRTALVRWPDRPVALRIGRGVRPSRAIRLAEVLRRAGASELRTLDLP